MRHGAGEGEGASRVDFATIVIVRLSSFAAEFDGVRAADQRELADQHIYVEELPVRFRSVADAAESGNPQAGNAEGFRVPEQILQTKRLSKVFSERAFLQQKIIRAAVAEAKLSHRIRTERMRDAQRDVLVVHCRFSSGKRQPDVAGL